MWEVYFDSVEIDGEIKDKFFTVVSEEPWLCLLINTRASAAARCNPEQFSACYVHLPKSRNPYLDYDSLVCCTDAFSFRSTFDPLGTIAAPDRKQVIRRVISCFSLVRRDRNAILRANNGIAAPIIKALTEGST